MPKPWKVGVLSLVMLSELDAPVSLEAARSGTAGTAGGVVSMTTLFSVGENRLVLPAGSTKLVSKS